MKQETQESLTVNKGQLILIACAVIAFVTFTTGVIVTLIE